MYIRNFLKISALILAVSGCATEKPSGPWFSEYGTMTAHTPGYMNAGNLYGSQPSTVTAPSSRRMAVLLPLSGDNADTGRAIRSSIEIAVLQSAPENLSVAFYDTARGATNAINTALATNPEVIVGPLFAADSRTLRAMKPSTLPAISFTSDSSAIGNGVMTISLMPTNSVEAIVREMQTDQVHQFVILAPNTNSGRMMAGAARAAATLYDIPVSGVVYYSEKDSESIKNAALRASLYNARTAANTRAREILSDILTGEQLTAAEKSSLSHQLNQISKSETLGSLPYDAVLFLGSADDAKALASFLRYYGVGARDARFYGTAMWDDTDAASDFTLSGAKFATLPASNEGFANVYELTTGAAPSRIATFGYDAANLAMGMLYSDKSNVSYLLDPSGYIGIDGLVRLTPFGASERALRIVELNGSGTIREIKPAAQNFLSPIYNVNPATIAPAREMAVETPGINPLNHIQIPNRLRTKYKSKSYGATAGLPQTDTRRDVITILPDANPEVITTPDYQPVSLETIGRTYIDSVEINE